MLGRLVLGIIKGALVGAAVAALLVKVLGVTMFAGALGWAAAVATGALAGFVAGMPFWRAAKIEAGLRALFGAALGAAGLWAIRRWLGFELDLTTLEAGRGLLGDLPATALPLLAATVGMLFELDNTPEGAEEASAAKTRVATDPQRIDVADLDEVEVGETGEVDERREARARRR